MSKWTINCVGGTCSDKVTETAGAGKPGCLMDVSLV